jgi:GGDEF domain-containing protein
MRQLSRGGFGVSSMTGQKAADPESLLRAADTTLYNIKKN